MRGFDGSGHLDQSAVLACLGRALRRRATSHIVACRSSLDARQRISKVGIDVATANTIAP